MNASIQYGSKRINFRLIYSDRKTLGIKVNPDLSVQVTAPNKTSIDQVLGKLKKKAPWIINQQNNLQKYHPITPLRKYVSGETHLYLGRRYRLKIHRSLKPSVKINEGFINVYSTSPANKEQVKGVLNSWYRERAEIIFKEIYENVSHKFKKRNILSGLFEIRNMKKRWGSCTPGKRIIINTELIKAPKGCIEYVITHEMCHLKHHNHNGSFYSLQNIIMPNWEFWKDKLERMMS